ncbi:hypothetical protein SZN_23621 [Streptomyces zinciresistens K42]|uniref:Uncharacterized protein n=1 Tax=Streptomyces zinciresistens K42 TaxID=700597 RepID=G2GGU0_9ACTN|nr:hypothetical protein [Streptomyces zinciresistens]EGX57286.1 hypothetical protein SZN_23621 [Streptomyces zinciresistens K42]
MTEQFALDDECGGGWQVEEIDGTWIRQRFSERRFGHLPPEVFARLQEEAPVLNMTTIEYLRWIVNKAEGAMLMMGESIRKRKLRKDDPEYHVYATWVATRAVVLERHVLRNVKKGKPPVWVAE